MHAMDTACSLTVIFIWKLVMARKTASDKPHPFDIALGLHIRLRRKELRLAQGGLAGRVSVTLQQIQKYEAGTNRVSFSRLVEISDGLECNVTDLIAGLDASTASATRSRHIAFLKEPGASALLEAYARIKSTKHRRLLRNLAGRSGNSRAHDPADSTSVSLFGIHYRTMLGDEVAHLARAACGIRVHAKIE